MRKVIKEKREGCSYRLEERARDRREEWYMNTEK